MGGMAMMLPTMAAWLHRIDPFAVHLYDNVGVRWYGLSYLAGFTAAYLILRGMAASGRSQLQPKQVGDFIVAAAIGTVVGGRLGYCVFYQPDLLLSWRVVALWDGGMASHGGMIGIILASVVYARRHGYSSLHLLDMTAFSGPVGVFFGRIANFVNGELYGRVTSPDLPWSVRFPQELEYKLQAPDVVMVIAKVRQMIADGIIRPVGDAYQNLLHAVQTNEQVAQMVKDLPLDVLPARHPSQLYQALLEGLAVFVVLGLVWMRPRKPGVIGGCFVVMYAIMRIIGEQFRMPDHHLIHREFAAWGVTRGQLLSGVMLMIGVGCLGYWIRRSGVKLGGWRR